MYTKKIKSPIYTPTLEKAPDVRELVNRKKTGELIDKIHAAEIKDRDIERFLLIAAQRHAVFDYGKIAEYYAHAPKEIQVLMEESALVIIDFDQAIENGFVKLSNEMARIYKNDQE